MPRRLAQLLISGQLLTRWLRDGMHGFVPVDNHLPDDAQMEGAYTHPDVDGTVIGLVFSSEHFPEHCPINDVEIKVMDLPVLTPIGMRPRHHFDIPISLN